MAEFDAYRRRVRTTGEQRDIDWSSRIGPQAAPNVLLAQNTSTPCDPKISDCRGPLEEAIVTASKRVAPNRTSITNNQEAAVDEGDIVKRYGRFLIVLQHARLFSIDTAADASGLTLVDRIDLYPPDADDAWYDELLIDDNHLIVTGYNYGAGASEITLVTIGTNGELELRARYFLESEDYYSINNYATRLVRGELVIYTPVDISKAEPLAIPRFGTWTPAAGFSAPQPLFDIKEVYRPIQATLTPMLHVVSVCRIDQTAALACDSRGVVGPGRGRHEMYVTESNIYLWVSSDYHYWSDDDRDECSKDTNPYNFRALPAAVYQLPLTSAGIRGLRTIGVPNDQFAFEERDNRLHALLERDAQGCYFDEATPLIFASIPLTRFSSTPTTLSNDAYVPVPTSNRGRLQTRYSDNYLIYAKSQYQWETRVEPDELIVVPIDRPWKFTVLQDRHAIHRVDLLGGNAVSVGPAGESDLGVSTFELNERPRLAHSVVIPGVVESEGRSHAFNALVAADGQGLFGLPTISPSQRYSDVPSDVQFFRTDRELTIVPLGELAGQNDVKDSYTCKVSCYDWYGNARPIFIGGRIFALTGVELIEGQLRSGTINEIGRLRMTGTPHRQQ